MAGRGYTKVGRSEAQIEIRVADDRALETFPPKSLDAVVMTLVLCTLQERTATLQLAWQALKPGGTLVILEHVRSKGAGGDLPGPHRSRMATFRRRMPSQPRYRRDDCLCRF